MLINDGGIAIALSNCQYCERYFCAQCNVPWHMGMDCRGFQSLNKDEREAEDIMLMHLAKNNKWIRCPKCRFYVEKSSGCSFIRCRYCLFLDLIHPGIAFESLISSFSHYNYLHYCVVYMQDYANALKDVLNVVVGRWECFKHNLIVVVGLCDCFKRYAQRTSKQYIESGIST